MNKNDSNTTMQEIKEMIAAFTKERDWDKFHSPKNLAMNLSVESAELLEKFLWMSEKQSCQEVDKNRQEIEDEAADVLFSVLAFCRTANIDISSAFIKKLEKIKKKYPIEKSKGIFTKYDKL